MPVINLPKDTRWGEVGEGLAKLVGGVLSAYGERKADQQVAEIMQDPLLTEPARLTKIMKEVPGGFDRYKSRLTADVLSATVAQKRAEAAKDLAAAGLTGGRQSMADAITGGGTTSAPSVPGGPGAIAPVPSVAPAEGVGAPTGAAPAAASPNDVLAQVPPQRIGEFISRTIDQRVAASGISITPEEKRVLTLGIAQRALKGEDIGEPLTKFVESKQKEAKFPSELSQSQSAATTAANTARTSGPLADASIKKSLTTELPKAAAELQSAQQTAAANAPAPGATPGLVGDAYQSFTPEQNQAVAAAWQTGGAKAGMEMTQSFVTANTAAARSGDADFRTRVTEAGGKVATFSRVMDDIETNPKLQGGPVQALAYPLLAKYGMDFGQIPPALYAEGATVDQLALQALQGHKGFGGSYLVPFVNATMPTVGKQKLLKAVESNFQAQQMTRELDSLKLAAQDKGQSTGQLDAALETARKLEERTGTLWWTAGPTSRVFYKGREINPDTWIPVEGGARELATKDYFRVADRSYTGAEINAAAKEAGQTPEEILARLRGQAGGGAAAAPAPAAAPAARAPATRPSDYLPPGTR